MSTHQVKDSNSDKSIEKKSNNVKSSEKDAAVLADVNNDSKKVTK